jgi:hypothetical protein
MNALTLFERELLSLFSSHIPLDSFSAQRGLSFLECTYQYLPFSFCALSERAGARNGAEAASPDSAIKNELHAARFPPT